MMEAPVETTEVPEGSHGRPKYSGQTPTAALGNILAPLEEARQDNWDSLEVPRRRRSDLPRRKPGSAWLDSSQLSGPLPTYSGYASPVATAAFGQARSLKPEDEEEIAAALFDLAKTNRGARAGLLGADQDSLILPSSRKRPRKPSRAGIKYETNYDVFDDEWDAEDEYLAKRRGVARPINSSAGNSGYPIGHPANNGNHRLNYNHHPGMNTMPGMLHHNNAGYPMPPQAPSNNGPHFKPGPNHVAISHFIQWHRQMKTQQQPAYPPPPPPPPAAAATSNLPAAIAAAALARAQNKIPQNAGGAGVRPPGGLDISALAALLPSLQAGLRQGGSGGSNMNSGDGNGNGSNGSQLAGLLGQLVSGQNGGRQLTPETLNVLQQLIRRQQSNNNNIIQQRQAIPAGAIAQPGHAPSQPPANLPANLAAVVARLKNAQAKAHGVAMAAAATQARPPPVSSGDPSMLLQNHHQQQQHQQQQPSSAAQPSPAFLQNLKAMLSANAQRANAQQQGMGMSGMNTSGAKSGAPLPPSHADLMNLMKQSLDIAKANNIGAWVAKKYQNQEQQQQQAIDDTVAAEPVDADAVLASALADTAPNVAHIVGQEPGHVQVKTESDNGEAGGQIIGEGLAAADAAAAAATAVAEDEDMVAKDGNSDTIPESGNEHGAPALATTNGSSAHQIDENGGAAAQVPHIPSFQPTPTLALEAMRAYLLQQKRNAEPREEGLESAAAAAEVNNNDNGSNGNEKPPSIDRETVPGAEVPGVPVE